MWMQGKGQVKMEKKCPGIFYGWPLSEMPEEKITPNYIEYNIEYNTEKTSHINIHYYMETICNNKGYIFYLI